MAHRVLIVCERIRVASGVSRGMRNLLRMLDRKRYKPFLCQFAPDTSDEAAHELNATDVPVKMKRCDDDFHRWDLAFLLALRRAVSAYGIDVIHSNTMEGLWYGQACQALTGVSLVHTEHAPIEPVQRRGWLKRRLVKHCDAFVVVSRGQGESLSRYSGIDPAYLSLIHNGVDCDTFQPDPAARARVRAELGVGEGDPVLLAVGRLAKQKNFPALLKAVARVVAARPGSVLWLAGDGPQKDMLLQTAAQMGLSGNVRLLGARSDMPAVYNAADLFVSASSGEAFSYAWIEAAATGLPIVGTRVDGADEAVVDGVTGRLVGQNAPDALAGNIINLVVSPELRQEMGLQGRQFVLKNFSIAAMTDKYMRIYDHCLRGSRLPAPFAHTEMGRGALQAGPGMITVASGASSKVS